MDNYDRNTRFVHLTSEALLSISALVLYIVSIQISFDKLIDSSPQKSVQIGSKTSQFAELVSSMDYCMKLLMACIVLTSIITLIQVATFCFKRYINVMLSLSVILSVVVTVLNGLLLTNTDQSTLVNNILNASIIIVLIDTSLQFIYICLHYNEDAEYL